MKKTLLIISILFFTLLLIKPVFSQGYQAELERQMNAAAGQQGANLGPANDPRMIAAVVINILLGLLGLLMTVYMVYAGFLMASSGGNEEKMAVGKNMIKNGAIGIFIIFSSYGVARFVEDALKITPQCEGVFCFSYEVGVQNVPQNYYNPDVFSDDIPNIGIQ